MSELTSTNLAFEADKPYELFADLIQQGNFDAVFEPGTAENARKTVTETHDLLDENGKRLEFILECCLPERVEAPQPADWVLAVHYKSVKEESGVTVIGQSHTWDIKADISATVNLYYPGMYAVRLFVADDQVNWSGIRDTAMLEELYTNS